MKFKTSYRILLLISIFILSASVFAGCGKKKDTWTQIAENGEINIALIGDGEFFTYGGALDAMQLAAEEFEKDNGTKVNIITYDDKGDYNTGVTLAESIAKDDKILVAISKQELDIIDTVASIFEENKKPLVVTNGSYDKTSESGFKYLITDFINATTTGQYMGLYAAQEGFTKIAYCHSNTRYEKDELKGVQNYLKESDINIIDTEIGPFSQEEFDECYSKWTKLGVDAVYISIYDYLYGSNIIRMLREKGSDIPVVTDYAMANDLDIETNGQYMEGTVILPLYPYQKNERYDKISDSFSAKYSYEASESVIQSYELIHIMCGILNSGVDTSNEFMEAMKSEKGHETTNGIIKFDENGVLCTDDVYYLRFSENSFKLYRNTNNN